MYFVRSGIYNQLNFYAPMLFSGTGLIFTMQTKNCICQKAWVMTVKITSFPNYCFISLVKTPNPQNEVAFEYMLIFTLQPYLSRKMK